MSIDLTRERPIPLADVPKLPWLNGRRGSLGIDGGKRPRRRLHISTLFRWCQRGIRGHRLEYVQMGGTKVTTEAALQRFFARLSETTPPKASTDRDREKLDRLEKELATVLD